MKRTKALSDLVGPKNAAKLPAAIWDLAKLSTDEIVSRGVTLADARKIRAAIELAREVAEPHEQYRIRINSPATAIRYCLDTFAVLARHASQEEFHLVTLDTKNQPIGKHLITRGTLRNSLVHPREVFRPAIADASNCILVVHNHPSGDPTPSDQDISVTERLESAAEIVGIPLIDHIIVAGDKGLSIQDWRNGVR